MREDLPSWLEDEESSTPARRTGPRWWLLALAVLPWLVIVGLAVTSRIPGPGPVAQPPVDESSPAAGAQTDGAPASPPDEEVDEPGRRDMAASAAPPPATDRPEDEAAGDRLPTAGDPDRSHDRRLEAVALLVARAWLTDVGPHLAVDGVDPRRDRYLEQAIVEEVEVAGDHGVVTVAAVVLEREDEAYTEVRARRLAVPVALGDPPRPAGPPWWLDEVELTPVEPELAAERDPDLLLALGEAVSAAGAATGEVLEAGRTHDGWWRVTTAPGPNDPADTPVEVWVPPDDLPSARQADAPPGTDAGERER